MKTKDEMKHYLKQYLEMKGINPQKNFRCLNPEHEDHNPSMTYYSDDERCHCHACNANYDIFDLVAIDYKLGSVKDNFPEILKKTYEIFGEPFDGSIMPKEKKENPTKKDADPTDFHDYIIRANKKLNNSQIAKDYLMRRGIHLQTANKFLIGFDERFVEHMDKEKQEYYRNTRTEYDGKAIVIPNNRTSLNARFITNDSIRYAKTGNGIFNLKEIKKEGYVFVTEGSFDALSIIEVGQRAIALNSTNNVNLFLKELGDQTVKAHLIIALDNDVPGITATKELDQRLESMGIQHSVASDLFGDFKDANERLIKERSELRTATENVIKSLKMDVIEEYRNSRSLTAFLKDFDDEMHSKKIPYTSTGFSKLDDELDGGLYSGLYIVGAISSLGKTTFTLQLADNIANQKHDVLFFSLEQSRNELISKIISRRTAEMSMQAHKNMTKASTVRTIMDSEKRSLIDKEQRSNIYSAFEEMTTRGKNFFVEESPGELDVTDIRSRIQEHIEITGNNPVVVIDYLQIIHPLKDSRKNLTDKQQIDYTVSELKKISRDFNIPVIAISSFNRSSYKNEVDLSSFKESGGIEYSSDVLIGLQFKGQSEKTNQTEEKKKLKRDIEIIVLKNRNGRSGEKLQYSYFTPFNYFVEQ